MYVGSGGGELLLLVPCSALGEKRLTGLSSSVTLARRLTVEAATEQSHEKPREPVKVTRCSFVDFNAWEDTERSLLGHAVACRRNFPLKFPIGKG